MTQRLRNAWHGFTIGCVIGCAMLLLALAVGCANPRPVARPKPGNPNRPVVFIFYGDGDATWSGGLNRLADSLRSSGCTVYVMRYRDWPSAVADAVASFPGNASEIVLIGHSYGAGAAVKAARALRENGRGVSLLVVLDGSWPRVPGNFTKAAPIPDPVPASVSRVLVICNPSTPIPFPGPPAPCPRLTFEPGPSVEHRLTSVGHTSIDDDAGIRAIVLESIR